MFVKFWDKPKQLAKGIKVVASLAFQVKSIIYQIKICCLYFYTHFTWALNYVVFAKEKFRLCI